MIKSKHPLELFFDDMMLPTLDRYAHLISKKNCGIHWDEGWHDIVVSIFKLLDESGFDDILVQQVKEKFGGLRFYYEGGDADLHEKVEALVNKSYQTCQICGSDGTQVTGGWITTRCGEHQTYRYPKLTNMYYDEFAKRLAVVEKKYKREPE